MNRGFTVEDKDLIMQYLVVLHGWLQETKAYKQEELNAIKLQEGIVKLIYSRLTAPEDMPADDIIAMAEDIFDQGETESNVPPGEGSSQETPDKVIDIASWIRTKREEDK